MGARARAGKRARARANTTGVNAIAFSKASTSTSSKASTSTTTSTSRFAPCPACARVVVAATLNDHLDRCIANDIDALEGKGKATRRAVCVVRGRRAHTGKTTTGYEPSDGLRGGWLDEERRARERERGGRARKVQSATTMEAKDAFERMMRASKERGEVKLPGNFVLENFITEEEERDVVDFLDSDGTNPWRDQTFNGAHQGKKYGVEVNLAKRVVERQRFGMPAILRRLVIDRFAGAHETLRNFEPNECNAINYVKSLGSVLTPHCDDRQLSSDILVNLSLNADCVMTYIEEKNPKKVVRVHLPRRSLQIQSGSTRYDYQHSIANEDLLGERRVSVTFRESGIVKSNKTPVIASDGRRNSHPSREVDK